MSKLEEVYEKYKEFDEELSDPPYSALSLDDLGVLCWMLFDFWSAIKDEVQMREASGDDEDDTGRPAFD